MKNQPSYSKFYKVFGLIWLVILVLFLAVNFYLLFATDSFLAKLIHAIRGPLLLIIFGIPIMFIFSFLIRIAEKLIKKM